MGQQVWEDKQSVGGMGLWQRDSGKIYFASLSWYNGKEKLRGEFKHHEMSFPNFYTICSETKHSLNLPSKNLFLLGSFV